MSEQSSHTMNRDLAERMARLIHARTGENVIASPAIFGGKIEYWVVARTTFDGTYYGDTSAVHWRLFHA